MQTNQIFEERDVSLTFNLDFMGGVYYLVFHCKENLSYLYVIEQIYLDCKK